MEKDLQRRVVRGAEQLHRVIGDIQAGKLDAFIDRSSDYTRIYPLVVTATDFPGIPTADRAVRHALEQQNLLKMNGVADLQVVSVQGLELLESVAKVGIDPIALLIERGDKEDSRIENVRDLIHSKAGKIPPNPRMQNAFLAMMEGLETWLTTGTFDGGKIDDLLFPSEAIP